MSHRRTLAYWLGALLVVAAVALWLWLTRPPRNTLPETYEYGVM